MLLRRYWQIIMRRIWITLLLLVVVTTSYFLFNQPSSPTYTASMRFVVGIEPESLPDDVYGYDRYYTWLTSEYLIDDLSEVVKSESFASDVAARSGIPVQANAIQGSTSSGKLHRILSISITWPDDQELQQIADTVVQVLTTNAEAYFKQLGTERTVISVIDSPHPTLVGESLRDRLDLPIRLLLALAVGILIEFLLDYLDTSIRSADDLRELGIPVLASVPSKRFWNH